MKSRLTVPFRRKLGRVTNYRKRLAILKGNLMRAVVRTSIRNVIIQLVAFDQKGDKVMMHADSKELPKYGWHAGGGNIPAAYLTGYLFGLRAMKSNFDNAVLDIGLHVSSKGNRPYAALKGMTDAGISIPHGEGCLPDENRICGKHIAGYAAQLGTHKTQFAGYLKAGINPAEMEKYVTGTKQQIKLHIDGAHHGKK